MLYFCRSDASCIQKLALFQHFSTMWKQSGHWLRPSRVPGQILIWSQNTSGDIFCFQVDVPTAVLSSSVVFIGLILCLCVFIVIIWFQELYEPRFVGFHQICCTFMWQHINKESKAKWINTTGCVISENQENYMFILYTKDKYLYTLQSYLVLAKKLFWKPT